MHSLSPPPLAGEGYARSAPEGAGRRSHAPASPPLPLFPAGGGEGPHEQAAPPSALIIGGAHGSLAIARSLGGRGIDVALLTDHPLTGFSRYVGRQFTWEGPGRDGALAHLIALAEREGLAGAVLFAGGDAEVRFIAQNHDRLASLFRLVTPTWDQVQPLVDKRLMYAHAASIGIAAPLGYTPRDRRDLDDMPCRFPLVLKPRERMVENALTLAKAWRVDDRAGLIARYDEATTLIGTDAIVLQELIPGGGETQFSYAAVFDRGAPLAELTARRRRQYPVEFGYTSTFVETIHCPAVADAGRRLLASLHYTGLAEVEFKYDQRDGRYKILDVNARIWSWAALGAAAGVDFPHVLWRLALGETVEPVRTRRHAAWMHTSRDLVAAGYALLTGRLSVAAYARGLRQPLVFAAFAADDPLPGLVELPLALWRGLSHRLPILARDFWRQIMVADTPTGAPSDAPPLTPTPDSPYSLSRFPHRTLPDPAD
jgi:predicted ATP-grasp superfamily ATP-dependent carboligase